MPPPRSGGPSAAPPSQTQQRGRNSSPGNVGGSQTNSPRKSPPGSATASGGNRGSSGGGSRSSPPSRSGTAGKRKKGSAGGASDASRKKREKLMIEVINAETLDRQVVIQQWTAEFAELQTRCEEDSKKTKDHYITILERRLMTMKAQTNARVDSMEDKFYEILQSVTRMLVDTHTLGAIGITEGAMVSEMSSSVSVASPSSSTPLVSKIVSPFSAAAPTAKGAVGIGTVAVQASLAALSADVAEEKIRRFFANPLIPSASKLENLNVKETVKRVDELRDGVTGLVSQCVARLSRANARVKELEHALEAQNASLASAEKLLQHTLVDHKNHRTNGDRSTPSSKEVLRGVGAEVKQRLDAFFERLKEAMDSLIAKSAESIVEHRRRIDEITSGSKATRAASPASKLRRDELDGTIATASLILQVRKKEMLDDFIGEVSALKQFQSELLRDIRQHMITLEQDSFLQDPLQAAKLFRSNIPDGYRRILHLCDAAYDRDALLRVIDRVSFIPEAAEEIIADVQTFVMVGTTPNGTTVSENQATPIDLFGADVEALIHAYSTAARGARSTAADNVTPKSAVEEPQGLDVAAASQRGVAKGGVAGSSGVARPAISIPASPNLAPPKEKSVASKGRHTPGSPRTPSTKSRVAGSNTVNDGVIATPPLSSSPVPSSTTPPPAASPSNQQQQINQAATGALVEIRPTASPVTVRSASPPQRHQHEGLSQLRYVKALNSTAFDLDPANYALKIRPGSGSGGDASRFALSTAVQKFKHLSASGNRSDSGREAVLGSIPSSDIMPPRLIGSATRYHLAQMHHEAAGVVVPTDAVLATPLLNGYAAAESHRFAQLHATLNSVKGQKSNGGHSVSSGAPHSSEKRLHPSMSPAVKRQVILDVLGEAEEDSGEADELAGGTLQRPMGALQKQFHQISRNFAACTAASPSAGVACCPKPPQPRGGPSSSPTLPSSARLFSVKQRELLDDLLSAA